MEGSRTDRFGVLWASLLYTGLRFGEAAALAWRDLDGEARTLTVARALERVAGGEPVFSDPKSYASRRPLRIPVSLADLLRAHKARQNTERLRAGSAYRDHGLVFASAGGAPLLHSNQWRSFKGLMRRPGLPAASPQACRHTAATGLRYAGVPLNEVSHLLGHAGVEVTAKVYAHAVVRGGASAWTPPQGLRGLDLLEAWYARAQADAGGRGDSDGGAAGAGTALGGKLSRGAFG